MCLHVETCRKIFCIREALKSLKKCKPKTGENESLNGQFIWNGIPGK